MSRIAKTDVFASFDRAAAIIRASDTNKDGRFSRAELKVAVSNLQGTERELVDMFSRFADHRDHRKYAKLTGKDLDRTLAYAKETLVAKYDVNGNGLSKDEIAKMSRTAQLAVQLAQESKALAAQARTGSMKA